MNFKSLSVAGLVCMATIPLAAASSSVDTSQASAASKPTPKPAVKSATTPIGAKTEAIKKLLTTSGTVGGNVEAAHNAIKGMMKNSPNINPKFWDELEKNVNPGAFEQMLVEVYDRNYTLEEIKGLTKFYASPTGKAFLEKNGRVLLESGSTLQTYMENNSKALMKKYAQPVPEAGPKKN